MHQKSTSCINTVGGNIACPNCQGPTIKYGRNKIGIQRFKCNSCNTYYLKNCPRHAYRHGINESISAHVKESCGIRSIARLLKISATTVI